MAVQVILMMMITVGEEGGTQLEVVVVSVRNGKNLQKTLMSKDLG